MSAEISIFDLFLQASLLVKSVMLILLGFSIACWAMIFQRRKAHNDAQAQMKIFEDINMKYFYFRVASLS